MKIGISSAVFYPLESEKAIEKALRLGFDTFEFFFNCDYEISEEFIELIKEKLDRAGARVLSIHPYTAFAESVFLFSEYSRRTDENIRRYAKSFKAAKKLGAKYFTFHGDRLQSGAEKYAFADRHCEALKRLAATALDNDIKLCLENVSWCKSSSPEYQCEVAQRVGDIFFTLDLKQARRAGVSVDEYISAMGERIMNLHLSDCDAQNDCLLPGEGEVDYSSFFEKMRKNGYNGDVIIEVYSSNFREEGQLTRSKRFLEDVVR
ncbi:MAG: sugar phosphate isomerase/epimerase [Oscillospiraceae bacterium]|nr:sugar phosphate isomerase/epimerase [Oscillospiraceae bacterium]